MMTAAERELYMIKDPAFKMQASVMCGHVQVTVPVRDCEGVTRTISFPRVGNKLYGMPKCHWTAKPFVRAARNVAAIALANQ